MKFLLALIGLAIAGAAGYYLEPSLRPMLVADRSPASEAEADEPVAAGTPSTQSAESEPGSPPEPVPQPTPEPPPEEPALAAAPAWVADLVPEQLPEKVSLKVKAEFTVPGTSEPMVLPAGASVTPVRMEGTDLVVSPFAGPIEGKVPVMGTDLVELLGNKPPQPVAMEPDPETSMEPTPTPTPEPEPVPTPAPEPSGALGPEQIVEVMQSSVKDGAIQEFSFEQVIAWEPGEEVERDGKTYQSGTVKYKAETIFGVKEIEAQALIEGGQVTLWIWPKSGMEIK